MITSSSSVLAVAFAPGTVATAFSAPVTQLLQHMWTSVSFAVTSAAGAETASANAATTGSRMTFILGIEIMGSGLLSLFTCSHQIKRFYAPDVKPPAAENPPGFIH